MSVPPPRVRLDINCNPALPPFPDLEPFKPTEEFDVSPQEFRPSLNNVVFDPTNNQPPDGRWSCVAHKTGAVLEFPHNVTVDAKLKTNSPFGSVILEDTCGSQKVGETVLNWRLQLQGELSVARGAGNNGANRLQVTMRFLFDCYMGGNPVAQPSNPPSAFGAPSLGMGPPVLGMGGAPSNGPPPMMQHQAPCGGHSMGGGGMGGPGGMPPSMMQPQFQAPCGAQDMGGMGGANVSIHLDVGGGHQQMGGPGPVPLGGGYGGGGQQQGGMNGMNQQGAYGHPPSGLPAW